MSFSNEMSALHDLVRDLEKERGTKIWCVLHCGSGHICAPTLYSIFKKRDEIANGDTVEILLHSGGGHPHIAYTAMKFFRRRFKKVNIIVPLQAKSAATLMCLGADKVFMGELADLGPIDIQIDDNVQHGARSFSPLDEFKSLEFLREQALEWMDYYAAVMNTRYGLSIKESLKDSIPLVTAVMRPVFEQIDPIQMGGYRRAIAIGEEYAKRMLAMVGNPNARQIIQKTVWGYPSHDFCIDFEEAKSLGIPVELLPRDQDRKLSTALINIDEDSYHGFAPEQPKPVPAPAAQPPASAAPAKPVRKGSTAKGKPAPQPRVNGSGGSGPTERIESARTSR